MKQQQARVQNLWNETSHWVIASVVQSTPRGEWAPDRCQNMCSSEDCRVSDNQLKAIILKFFKEKIQSGVNSLRPFLDGEGHLYLCDCLISAACGYTRHHTRCADKTFQQAVGEKNKRNDGHKAGSRIYWPLYWRRCWKKQYVSPDRKAPNCENGSWEARAHGQRLNTHYSQCYFEVQVHRHWTPTVYASVEPVVMSILPLLLRWNMHHKQRAHETFPKYHYSIFILFIIFSWEI